MIDYKEYFRTAERRLKLFRYLVLVFLVIFIVFSITFCKEEITFDNLRYLMKYIEISPPSISADEGSFSYFASAGADFALSGDKLTVINDNSIKSFDMGGRKILDEDIRYKNPVSVSRGKYVLIYDLDGYSLSVYNSFSKVCEKTLPTQIEYVYLSEDGGFAVITKEKSYAGGVVCYNNKFAKVFSFMTRTSDITDVCFDGQRGLLACATTDVRDGDYYSEVFTFDISDDENIRSKTEIYGEFPLSMFCAGKNFVLMTDTALHCIDYNGNKVKDTGFSYDTPASLYLFDDCFAVACKSALAVADVVVNVYNYDAEQLVSVHLIEELSSIDISDGKMYILKASGVDIYEYNKTDSVWEPAPPYIFETRSDEKMKRIFSLSDGKFLLVSSSGASRHTVGDDEREQKEAS